MRAATVESVIQTRSKPGPKPAFSPGSRICTECGVTKPVADFTPIRSTKAGFYGRCRPCRARLAWERSHPGKCYENRPLKRTSNEVQEPPTPKSTKRACSDCGTVKEVAEFTAIKACKAGWYGRCRVCRARRARERYAVDPEERERQKTRVRPNRLRKMAARITQTSHRSAN
jgi:hypothetical protein